MTRVPLISGNWKMNMNHFEAIQLVQKLGYALAKHDFEAVNVTVHPPFTDIRSVQTVIDADRMKFLLGAQNCHSEISGAFTGEVSTAMLSKMAVSYVIVGHSERRHFFGETDEDVASKAVAVHAQGMTPIVCVGETLEQRENGNAREIVETQVRGSLSGLKKNQLANIVVAYEPVWAIGTGVTASVDDAQGMCSHIRHVVESMQTGAGEAVRIQYGGSVKPSNATELMACADIDGALVGGAALDSESFARIVMYQES